MAIFMVRSWSADVLSPAFSRELGLRLESRDKLFQVAPDLLSALVINLLVAADRVGDVFSSRAEQARPRVQAAVLGCECERMPLRHHHEMIRLGDQLRR